MDHMGQQEADHESQDRHDQQQPAAAHAIGGPADGQLDRQHPDLQHDQHRHRIPLGQPVAEAEERKEEIAGGIHRALEQGGGESDAAEAEKRGQARETRPIDQHLRLGGQQQRDAGQSDEEDGDQEGRPSAGPGDADDQRPHAKARRPEKAEDADDAAAGMVRRQTVDPGLGAEEERRHRRAENQTDGEPGIDILEQMQEGERSQNHQDAAAGQCAASRTG